MFKCSSSYIYTNKKYIYVFVQKYNKTYFAKILLKNVVGTNVFNETYLLHTAIRTKIIGSIKKKRKKSHLTFLKY